MRVSHWGFQPDVRTTAPAGIRLRVKAPIQGIVILGLALGAHGKSGHRGLWPVVGNAARDSEARTAVRAIQKRIPIAPIRRVEQFAQAIGTGGGVCGNAGADPAKHLAGHDPKAWLPG